MRSFENRRVLITGSGRGIGKAIAHRFARRCKGFARGPQGPFLETLAQCAAPGAQIIEYGWLTAEPTPFPLFTAFQKGLTVRGYTIYEFVNDRLLRPEAEKFITVHLTHGSLRPRIDHTFPLSQIVNAHRYLESNEQIGKVVVTIN